MKYSAVGTNYTIQWVGSEGLISIISLLVIQLSWPPPSP